MGTSDLRFALGLLAELRPGHAVPDLQLPSNLFERDSSDAVRRQKVRRAVDLLAEAGYAIERRRGSTVLYDAAEATPADARRLYLTEREAALVERIDGLVSEIAGHRDEESGAAVVLKSHVPREVVRFRYGEVKVEGRAAHVVVGPNALLVIEQPEGLRSYRVSHVHDLKRVGVLPGTFRQLRGEVPPVVEPIGSRPRGAPFFAPRRRGRPRADEELRDLRRVVDALCRTIRSWPRSCTWGYVALTEVRDRTGFPQEHLSKLLDQLSKPGLVENTGDEVFVARTLLAEKIRAFDGSAALMAYLHLTLLDELGDGWLLDIDDSEQRAVDGLRKRLAAFLPHAARSAGPPSPVGSQLLHAQREAVPVLATLDGRTGLLLVDHLPLLDWRWHVTGEFDGAEITQPIPIERFSRPGRASQMRS